MHCRNSVDGMAADRGQVRHPDGLGAVFADDRHPPHPSVVTGEPGANLLDKVTVDLVDDFQVPRQELLEHRQGPGFQRLRQQCVVGVAHRRNCDAPGLIPAEPALVDQQPHQFGHGDRGMGVIELHCHPIGKLAHITACEVFNQVQDVLQ